MLEKIVAFIIALINEVRVKLLYLKWHSIAKGVLISQCLIYYFGILMVLIIYFFSGEIC